MTLIIDICIYLNQFMMLRTGKQNLCYVYEKHIFSLSITIIICYGWHTSANAPTVELIFNLALLLSLNEQINRPRFPRFWVILAWETNHICHSKGLKIRNVTDFFFLLLYLLSFTNKNDRHVHTSILVQFEE